MKRDMAAVLFLLLMVAFIAIGCRQQKASTDHPATQSATGPAKTASRAGAVGEYLQAAVSANASPDVAKAMGTLWTAGVAFMAIGGLMAVFVNRGAGLNVMGVGFLMYATGVFFVQFPWGVLIVAAGIGVAVLVNAIYQWKTKREATDTRDTLKTVASIIQTIPEGAAVKAALKALGFEAVEKLDAVIDPLKKELKAEGKIT